MSTAHFTPWHLERRPCWHCTSFLGVVAGGSAARCGDIDFSSQVARMKAADVDLILAGTRQGVLAGISGPRPRGP